MLSQNPFHELAKQLTRQPESAFSHSRSLPEAVLPGFWPEIGNPLSYIPQSNRSTESERRNKPMRLNVVDPASLADTLIQCHIWLTTQVTTFLVRVYAPFSSSTSSIPSEFLAMSPDAITRAFQISLLDNPASKRVKLDALEKQLPPLTSASPPGDVLSLHILVQALVIALPARLRLPLRRPSTHGKPGGLRDHQFLSAWTALADAADKQKVRNWLSILRPLTAASPLTCTIYADLFADWAAATPAPEKQKGSWLSTLKPLLAANPLTRARYADLSVKTNPEQPVFFPEVISFQNCPTNPAWKRDFWYAQLARSLVGSILSAPPAFEALCKAEEHYDRLLHKEQWEWPWPPFRRRAIAKEKERCDNYRRHRLAQEVAKLSTLVMAIQMDRDGQTGDTYLHLRFLDMLIRQTVLDAMPSLIETWAQESRRRDLPRAQNALFFEKASPSLQTFERNILGQSINDIWLLLTGSQQETVRNSLERLLFCPERPNPTNLASQANIPKQSAARIVERFYGKRGGAVALPFAPPHDQGPWPAELATDWWQRLHQSMQPEEEVRRIADDSYD